MASPDVQWMRNGACVGKPTELFFTINDAGRPLREAQEACGGCAVKVECLAYALSGDAAATGNPRDTFGVWGGTTPTEREKLLRYVPRVKCPLCLGASLRTLPQAQVCLGCGQSWPTVRPIHQTQTRENADAA